MKASQSQRAEVDLLRKESLLVPSSIPEQAIEPMELEAEPVLQVRVELDGSPVDSPPPYSADLAKPAPWDG